ncbi:hypothetical protein DACRYDRAFT_117825 [Dacryopinax primogenitus]|uniref:Uncharacterized protein n=1 Tax=Dacryopinax primogenitus (strain DJM 731) TaxID=1858805 RepID=M5FRA3_DACPD|nr:uncharacterized protein DACRYDRAFT_117825 [Dacryopinax primogenitus]EJT99625.1 hypothetical protein DACRYDRAFT_117825 [Dacryopinax primogenitus]
MNPSSGSGGPKLFDNSNGGITNINYLALEKRLRTQEARLVKLEERQSEQLRWILELQQLQAELSALVMFQNDPELGTRYKKAELQFRDMFNNLVQYALQPQSSSPLAQPAPSNAVGTSSALQHTTQQQQPKTSPVLAAATLPGAAIATANSSTSDQRRPLFSTHRDGPLPTPSSSGGQSSNITFLLSDNDSVDSGFNNTWSLSGPSDVNRGREPEKHTQRGGMQGGRQETENNESGRHRETERSRVNDRTRENTRSNETRRDYAGLPNAKRLPPKPFNQYDNSPKGKKRVRGPTHGFSEDEEDEEEEETISEQRARGGARRTEKRARRSAPEDDEESEQERGRPLKARDKKRRRTRSIARSTSRRRPHFESDMDSDGETAEDESSEGEDRDEEDEGVGKNAPKQKQTEKRTERNSKGRKKKTIKPISDLLTRNRKGHFINRDRAAHNEKRRLQMRRQREAELEQRENTAKAKQQNQKDENTSLNTRRKSEKGRDEAHTQSGSDEEEDQVEQEVVDEMESEQQDESELTEPELTEHEGAGERKSNGTDWEQFPRRSPRKKYDVSYTNINPTKWDSAHAKFVTQREAELLAGMDDDDPEAKFLRDKLQLAAFLSNPPLMLNHNISWDTFAEKNTARGKRAWQNVYYANRKFIDAEVKRIKANAVSITDPSEPADVRSI